jgi:hypothetical protein
MLYIEIMDADRANLEEYINNYTVCKKDFFWILETLVGKQFYRWK